ncbi:hypothetical protein KAS08_02810 [Candidatus Pacearchaeota archaeon]|nr:hypothetical protein [Candidatus Pacearchaeota archaeon]
MKNWGSIFVLLVIFTTSLALAEISISEPLDIYNLGDRLYVSLDGLIGSNSGNLNINLVCHDESTNLVKISSRAFSTTDEQSYSIPYKILDKNDLEITNLSRILGECQIISSLGNKISSTKTFSIVDDVIVAASLDKATYNPGEAITVNVEAIKKNGHPLKGFIEATNATSFSKAIENGKVSEVFSLPETAEAGTYLLNIYVYDVGADSVLNTGSSEASFKINQIASSIVMSLSDSKAIPGEEFTIGMEIFDQSGIKMDGTVGAEIITPDNKIIEKTINSGELTSINFLPNSTAGIWRISASFNGLIEQREFQMEEIQKVEFDIEDSVLTVTNVGNSLYNKTISVQIGGEERELELKINMGETRKFNLGAPNGKYEVLVDDGETSINRQILLTGNVISVSNFNGFNFFKNYGIFLVFLIAIVGSVGFIYLKKSRKSKVSRGSGEPRKKINLIKFIKEKFNKKIPKNVKSHINESLHYTNKCPKVQSLDSSNYSHEDKSMIDLTKDKIKSAESSLVLKGEKHISSVISLRIKNNEGMSDVAKDSLHKIIENAQAKGLVDWRGDYIFVVFSPVATRTYHNEILAVKVAQEITQKLKDYNKKFRDKIEFNVGVNSGDMIASKVDGKLKYTSIGSTISFAKRVSDSDSGKILISDSIRKKLLRDLKVERGKEIGENPTYELLDIKNRSGDAERLKDLMKRSNY